jgi:hypothetical protein
MKWGIKRMPGINKKAGKVIRLKIPKTTKTPSTVDERIEDRCFTQVRIIQNMRSKGATNLRVHYALNQDQTPGYDESLDRIREGMCLISPGHVGRGDKENSNSSMTRRLDELMDGPILQDKAHEKHQDPKRPKYCNRWNLAVLAIADPEPPQQQHWKAIDGP